MTPRLAPGSPWFKVRPHPSLTPGLEDRMPEDGGLALADAPRLQRAAGLARVTFGQRDGQAVLADLHQSGCAKAFLPRIHGPVP